MLWSSAAEKSTCKVKHAKRPGAQKQQACHAPNWIGKSSRDHHSAYSKRFHGFLETQAAVSAMCMCMRRIACVLFTEKVVFLRLRKRWPKLELYVCIYVYMYMYILLRKRYSRGDSQKISTCVYCLCLCHAPICIYYFANARKRVSRGQRTAISGAGAKLWKAAGSSPQTWANQPFCVQAGCSFITSAGLFNIRADLEQQQGTNCCLMIIPPNQWSTFSLHLLDYMEDPSQKRSCLRKRISRRKSRAKLPASKATRQIVY